MNKARNKDVQTLGYVIRGHVFVAPKIEPGLYIAATPIGNLSDISLRVLETLAGCDLIACEDTRVTGKLLHRFGINTAKVAYHEHNSATAGPKIVKKMMAGQSIALVSDAGTPLISDPGFKLVETCRQKGLRVVPLPGASAPLTALVASGLPSENWTFNGFLPSKAEARKSMLESNASRIETTIYFESPNRLLKTLSDMLDIFGPDRVVCVARELTKQHEEVLTATLSEILIHFSSKPVKGEIVLLVSPGNQEGGHDPERLLLDLLETMSVSKAAAEASQLTGLSKRELYQQALRLKDKN